MKNSHQPSNPKASKQTTSLNNSTKVKYTRVLEYLGNADRVNDIMNLNHVKPGTIVDHGSVTISEISTTFELNPINIIEELQEALESSDIHSFIDNLITMITVTNE